MCRRIISLTTTRHPHIHAKSMLDKETRTYHAPRLGLQTYPPMLINEINKLRLNGTSDLRYFSRTSAAGTWRFLDFARLCNKELWQKNNVIFAMNFGQHCRSPRNFPHGQCGSLSLSESAGHGRATNSVQYNPKRRNQVLPERNIFQGNLSLHSLP